MTDPTLIKEQVIRILNLKDIHPQDIKDEAPLFNEGLGLDSVDVVVLAMGLEKQYGIRIGTVQEAKQAFASIKALTDYISGHKAN